MLEGSANDVCYKEISETIVHELPNGIVFDFTIEQYARDWVLGQFYFHIMTAYSILRKENVDLGKADYVAHLFPLIRPETMPTNQ